MQSKVIEQSGFLKDKYKPDLNNNDFFDRIINVKLVTSKGNEYVIRSDYEIVYPAKSVGAVLSGKGFDRLQNKCVIQKCQFKPAIKVAYNQLSRSCIVGLDIYITNFYAFGNNGKTLMQFTSKDERLVSVEVAMGYWGQFKSLKPESIAEWKDFSKFNGKGRYGLQTIKSNVEYAKIDSLTPDAVFHIHGYCGSTDLPLTSTVTDTTSLLQSEKALTYQTSSSSTLKDFLTKTLSCRYLKNPLTDADMEKVIDSSTGLLKKTAVEDYGVKFYVSDGAEAKFTDIAQPLIGADGKKVNQVFNVSVSNCVQNALRNTLFELDPYFLFQPIIDGLTGDTAYMVFVKEEVNDLPTLREKFTGVSALPDNKIDSYYENILPAVYSITHDGTICNISCPFFTFIQPFSPVVFNSRYALSKLINYYASAESSGDIVYNVINVNISFSTCDSANEMLMLCINQGKK